MPRGGIPTPRVAPACAGGTVTEWTGRRSIATTTAPLPPLGPRFARLGDLVGRLLLANAALSLLTLVVEQVVPGEVVFQLLALAAIALLVVTGVAWCAWQWRMAVSAPDRLRRGPRCTSVRGSSPSPTCGADPEHERALARLRAARRAWPRHAASTSWSPGGPAGSSRPCWGDGAADPAPGGGARQLSRRSPGRSPRCWPGSSYAASAGAPCSTTPVWTEPSHFGLDQTGGTDPYQYPGNRCHPGPRDIRSPHVQEPGDMTLSLARTRHLAAAVAMTMMVAFLGVLASAAPPPPPRRLCRSRPTVRPYR